MLIEDQSSNPTSTLVEKGIGQDLIRGRGKRPKLFVLGAGVSREFGIPLANDILDNVIEWHQSSGNGRSCRLLLQFVDTFYHDAVTRNGKLPPAEDVLTFLDSAGEYSHLRSGGVGYRWRTQLVSEIRRSFSIMLAEYLWNFQLQISPDQLVPLRTLISATGAGHVYVSFNYDLLLETCLSLEGIPFHYTGYPRSDTVLVLKPHGSINWFYAKELGAVADSEKLVALGNEICAFKGLMWGQLPFRKMKVPVLIPPTINKQFSTFEQRKIWTMFSNVVQKTALAFIIGYSLPNIDHMARIVMNRLGAHQSQSRRIHIINPDKRLSNHYADLVSQTHYFIPITFGEWTRTYPYFLKNRRERNPA